jgi:hypothetical protein
VTQSKPEKSGKSEQCSVEVETDDLLDLDRGPTAEAESDADLMKALDSEDFVASTPAPQEAEWLADFKALARKHGPFSTSQVMEIFRALNAGDDPAAEAGH